MRTVPLLEFNPEQQREHVLHYLSLPHGQKMLYLDEHRIAKKQIYIWRRALADGDIDRDAVPRHTGSMAREDVAEIRRLQAEVARAEQERDQALQDLEQSREVADALGKAINVMQSVHGGDSDEDGQN
ncbi:MAG: hypothetical protein L0G69_18620 [Brevibacterium sp.]|uniref:hypothetical protein n=1 Tax=Corynebacterium sp. TaxID=1720 RepID=UPI002649C4B1|nr:hypothetical protein [Corynebacterium sp.]MDN5588572.1 hypothetical protein [Brevibacterium sp.]MDN6406012.1 hypothetical protein [Corynebacterium sp.]